MSTRAEVLMDVFYEHYPDLEPNSVDHVCVAEIIRTVSDHLLLYLGELEHPSDILNEIADEVEKLNIRLTNPHTHQYTEVVHNNHYDRMETY